MEASTTPNQSTTPIADMQKAAVAQMQSIAAGTSRIIAATQARLEPLPQELKDGLDRVGRMFVWQFGFGIGLLAASVLFYLLRYEVLTYIFGSTGGLTLVTTFLKTPPLQLQKNRIDLSQWTIAYFNWLNTLIATSGVVVAMQGAGSLTWEIFRDAHTFLLSTTERTLRIIDEACEFSEAPPEQRENGPNEEPPGKQ
ncbi:MAG TPA: hypothetical protein VNE39_22570 [Planctomycetota bacterium]|nr:hypothetical protein [Planctomycetota bacterium]